MTVFGREKIELTKHTVEKTFFISEGCSEDSAVVYGDSDSVLIGFGVNSLENYLADAMELGKEAAACVSSQLTKPIKLECGKVCCPYLLINKKRYVSLQ
ncbi:MAG: DNA polymerase domain-containing protein [Anaerolineales bacterium]